MIGRFHVAVVCHRCPFRKRGGVRIMPDHAEAIARGMLDEGGGYPFACHETTEATDKPPNAELHCAGALLFAEAHGVENQCMQIARRLGGYDPGTIPGASLIFRSVKSFVAAQLPRRERK